MAEQNYAMLSDENGNNVAITHGDLMCFVDGRHLSVRVMNFFATLLRLQENKG